MTALSSISRVFFNNEATHPLTYIDNYHRCTWVCHRLRAPRPGHISLCEFITQFFGVRLLTPTFAVCIYNRSAKTGVRLLTPTLYTTDLQKLGSDCWPQLLRFVYTTDLQKLGSGCWPQLTIKITTALYTFCAISWYESRVVRCLVRVYFRLWKFISCSNNKFAWERDTWSSPLTSESVDPLALLFCLVHCPRVDLGVYCRRVSTVDEMPDPGPA